MTFSDTRIVSFVKENFVPVWESVAPVTTVIYDLGDGESVKATTGGEIALYFCRPDGKVFDILPGLQSPKTTYEAMKHALAFYQETGATDEAILAYHQERLAKLAKKGIDSKAIQYEPSSGEAPTEPTVKGVVEAWQALAREQLAGRDITRLDPKATSPLLLRDPNAAIQNIAAKAIVAAPTENILIIEPRGIDLFGAQISAALSVSEPKTPEGWKEHVFRNILGQSLEGGGEIRFDIESDTGSLSVVQ